MSESALLALHSRLIADTAPPFDSEDRKHIVTTPAGRAWLRDYARYEALYRQINGPRYTGTGDADRMLNAAFGYLLPGDDVQDEKKAENGGSR